MILRLVVSETPNFLEHIFSQKTQLDTSSMVIWPGTFLDGNIFCTNLLLSFIVLIYISATGTCSSSDTGFNVTFNYVTAP